MNHHYYHYHFIRITSSKIFLQKQTVARPPCMENILLGLGILVSLILPLHQHDRHFHHHHHYHYHNHYHYHYHNHFVRITSSKNFLQKQTVARPPCIENILFGLGILVASMYSRVTPWSRVVSKALVLHRQLQRVRMMLFRTMMPFFISSYGGWNIFMRHISVFQMERVSFTRSMETASKDHHDKINKIIVIILIIVGSCIVLKSGTLTLLALHYYHPCFISMAAITALRINSYQVPIYLAWAECGKCRYCLTNRSYSATLWFTV